MLNVRGFINSTNLPGSAIADSCKSQDTSSIEISYIWGRSYQVRAHICMDGFSLSLESCSNLYVTGNQHRETIFGQF